MRSQTHRIALQVRQQRSWTKVVCAAEPPNSQGKGSSKPNLVEDPLNVLADRRRTFFGFDHTKFPWQDKYSSYLRQWQTTSLLVSDSQHKELVQKAAGTPSLSFGFSAGGCLFPYYIGIAGALQDGKVLNDQTPLGGASAGAIMAACLSSGMDLDEMTTHCLELMDDCRRNGTRGRLGPVLENFLQSYLPKDAHERCQGRAHIAVTAAFPYIKPKLINTFHSRDDLIQAVMTSCHIPYWLDSRPVKEFRGSLHLDGGLTNFIPIPKETIGVRICCFPSKQVNPLYRIGISPDTFDENWPYTLSEMVGFAFEPADEDVVLFLIDKGKSDAKQWMEMMELKPAAAQVEKKDERKEGQVAAAKTAAAGGVDDDEVQREKIESGGEKLEEQAADQKNRNDEPAVPVV